MSACWGWPRPRHDRYFTSSGKETNRADSPLKQARDALAEADTIHADLQLKQEEYGAAVDRYVRVSGEIEEIDRQLPALRQTLHEANKAVEQVKTLKQKQERLTAALNEARLRRETFHERKEARDKLRAQTRRAKASLDAAETSLTDMVELARRHAEQRAPLESEERDARAATEQADRLRKRAAAHVEYLRHRDRHEELKRQLQKARGLHDQIIEAKGKLESEPITKSAVKKLQDLERKVREAELSLEAAAASVEIKALADVEIDVAGEGQTLKSGEAKHHLATSPLDIRVGKQATIRVTPGGEDLADRRAAVEKARAKLQEPLEAEGVASADEASERLEQKQQIEQGLKSDQKLLAVHAPDGVDALQAATQAVEPQD